MKNLFAAGIFALLAAGAEAQFLIQSNNSNTNEDGTIGATFGVDFDITPNWNSGAPTVNFDFKITNYSGTTVNLDGTPGTLSFATDARLTGFNFFLHGDLSLVANSDSVSSTSDHVTVAPIAAPPGTFASGVDAGNTNPNWDLKTSAAPPFHHNLDPIDGSPDYIQGGDNVMAQFFVASQDSDSLLSGNTFQWNVQFNYTGGASQSDFLNWFDTDSYFSLNNNDARHADMMFRAQGVGIDDDEGSSKFGWRTGEEFLIPEPSTYGLMGAAFLLGLIGYRRYMAAKRAKKAAGA